MLCLYFSKHFFFTFLQDKCEIQKNSISAGQKVVIIDDLLATGGN